MDICWPVISIDALSWTCSQLDWSIQPWLGWPIIHGKIIYWIITVPAQVVRPEPAEHIPTIVLISATMTDSSSVPQDTAETVSRQFKHSWFKRHWPEIAFFSGLTGMSMLVGFGTTLAAAKKSDPTYFGKGMTPEALQDAKNVAELYESGSSLALRALRRATLYSVGGFTVFCLSVWKLSGANTFEEFRQKMGQILPVVPRNNPPTSKEDFEDLSELFQYVIDEDKRKKNPAASVVKGEHQPWG